MLKIKNIHLISEGQPLDKLKILNKSLESSLLQFYNADEIDTEYITLEQFYDVNITDCNIYHLNLIRASDNNFKFFYNNHTISLLNRFLNKDTKNILVIQELLENINHIPAIKTYFPEAVWNRINFITSNISIESDDVKIIKSLLLLPYTYLFLNKTIPQSKIEQDFFIPANTVRNSKFIVLHLLKHANLLNKNYSYGGTNIQNIKEFVLNMYKDSPEIELLKEALNKNVEENILGKLYQENAFNKNKYFNLNFSEQLLKAQNKSLINIILEDKADHDRKENNFNQLSEKFFIPISLKKPFVVFYCANFLKEMKEYGFKSFAPFINEEYDLVEDDIVRYKLVIKEMKKISEMSDTEKNKFIENVTPICEHNFNIMSEYIQNKNFLK